MSDYKRLRELAQAATPGPWRVSAGNVHPRVKSGDGSFVMEHRFGCRRYADAQYIAAANPAAVLALLDRLERAEADAERWQFIRDPIEWEVEPRTDDGGSGTLWRFWLYSPEPFPEDQTDIDNVNKAVDAAIREWKEENQ